MTSGYVRCKLQGRSLIIRFRKPIKLWSYICITGKEVEIAPYVVQGLNTNLNLGPGFLTKANGDLKNQGAWKPKIDH